TYEGLYQIYMQPNNDYLNHYSHLHLKKAQKEKDTYQIIQAYRMRAYDQSFKDGMASIDTAFQWHSRMKLVKSNKSLNLKALINHTKATLLYRNDNNVKAALEMVESWRYAKAAGNERLVNGCLEAIGSIKTNFGQEKEGLRLTQKNLHYLIENKAKINFYQIRLLSAYDDLARAYAFNEQLDSAQYFLDLSLALAKQQNAHTEILDLSTLQAKLNFYRGDFQKCIDTLNAYSKPTITDQDDFYYMAMAYSRLGKERQAIEQMLIRDSLLNSKGYPLKDNVVETYQFLLDKAIEKNDMVSEKRYFKRLVYYDSLQKVTQKALRDITLDEFDIPFAQEEKASLFSALNQKTNTVQWLSAFAFLLVFTSIGLYINQNNTKNRLKQVMAQTIEMEGNLHEVNEETSALQPSEELAKSIKDWEDDRGFLDPEVSLQSLAKRFDTNTAYLSRNINLLKGQNFSSYLKDIRVTHAINYMKSHPKIIQEKSQIQLAEMFGFSSLSVFNRSIKSKIKVTLGAFTKEIRKQHMRSKNPQFS
ncbi:MAG: AraC family transcriptional regulator, partial [Bacteroidota bacterium]